MYIYIYIHIHTIIYKPPPDMRIPPLTIQIMTEQNLQKDRTEQITEQSRTYRL